MKKIFLFTAMAFLICILLFACASSNVGSATKDEQLKMKIKEQRNIIDPEKLQAQKVLSLDERALAEKGAARGVSVIGSLVSLATDAVKKVIVNEKKKYVADYAFGITDLYFYDQLSNDGAFDPVGLQFSGFKLIRTFINNAGNTDTAMIANFTLDTVNSASMINNSVFRLRVKDFDLRYAKAKLANNAQKKLNLDIEISFLTSYVNSDGILFDGVVLGKFYLFLRDAPLDQTTPAYNKYYQNLKDSLLIGKSFIVPRSFGYHREQDGLIKPGFSQGAYSIKVKVKESSKDHFVNQLVIGNSNLIIDATSDKLKQTLRKL